MAESPNNIHNKRSFIQTSQLCHRRRAAGRNQQVEEYKHTHRTAANFIPQSHYVLLFSVVILVETLLTFSSLLYIKVCSPQEYDDVVRPCLLKQDYSIPLIPVIMFSLTFP